MTAVLVILGIVLIVLVWWSVYDYLLFKKFKVGYTIELYKLKHIALEYYECLGAYTIIARKNEYISVKDDSGKIYDYDIYLLLSTYDKTIIRDENGFTYDILYKIEACEF